jgi:hypothetical protein
MFRRQSTTSDSTDASAYSRRAAIVDAIWVAQDRVRSRLGGVAREAGQSAERAAFPVQERIVWPLADRAEAMGAPARALSFGAVVLLAAAAGVAGLIWAAPDGPHNSAPTAAVVATAPPSGASKAAAAKPAEPTLHGATPVFKSAAGEASASQVDPAKAVVRSTPSHAPAESAAASSPAASSAAAESSTHASAVDGPPAGPAAVAVARSFSDAFVVYETGGSDGKVRRGFGETATPALAKALLRRPPRLPAKVKVPEAKVVNVVPGPSHDGVYPVSVSLLRVGLTSELRLEMERRKGDGWRVTNVLG